MNIFIETTIHIDKIFEEFKRRSEIWKKVNNLNICVDGI